MVRSRILPSNNGHCCPQINFLKDKAHILTPIVGQITMCFQPEKRVFQVFWSNLQSPYGPWRQLLKGVTNLIERQTSLSQRQMRVLVAKIIMKMYITNELTEVFYPLLNGLLAMAERMTKI